MKRQRTAIAVKLERDNSDELKEKRIQKLEKVAAPSGNDVWIVQMGDCTICTCGDFQRCRRSSRLQEAETQPFESYHRGRKLTEFRDCFLHLCKAQLFMVYGYV